MDLHNTLRARMHDLTEEEFERLLHPVGAALGSSSTSSQVLLMLHH